jgi:prophage DNA circulation protein
MATTTTKGKRHTRIKRVANNNNNNNNIMNNSIKAITANEENAFQNIRFTQMQVAKQFISSALTLDETTKTVNKMAKRMFNVEEYQMHGFEYVEVIIRNYSGSVGQPRKLFKIRIPLHLINR